MELNFIYIRYIGIGIENVNGAKKPFFPNEFFFSVCCCLYINDTNHTLLISIGLMKLNVRCD